MLKFLFDTNAVIPAEPTSLCDAEPGTPIVCELLRLLNEGGHQACLHPASIRELRGDNDPGRRGLRETLISKYPLIERPPPMRRVLEEVVGNATIGSHDEVDHLLLAAVAGNAVDYLVTHDQRLLKKAKAAGLQHRVLTADDATAAVRGLFRKSASPPPNVEDVPCHALNEEDPIFDSLREDYYPGFDQWLDKCKLAQRRAYVVRGSRNELAGVCILKEEPDCELELQQPVLKICTFKISEQHQGHRYGELLLKSIFAHLFDHSYASSYVTVFERHAQLVSLFEENGYLPIEKRTALGELVLAKHLTFAREEYDTFDPLEFNRRFGPRNVKAMDTAMFVVPIQPRFHDLLFPELAPQIGLFNESQNPFGNSISKAYLCNSNARSISAGDVLLFYESSRGRGIRCIGVAEDTLASSDAAEIARFVGRRTVYSFGEIERLCTREVLAIVFRQALALPTPLSLDDLVENAVLKKAPQSIVRVKMEGKGWLTPQIES